jgi:hypothetical protein
MERTRSSKHAWMMEPEGVISYSTRFTDPPTEEQAHH